jgi:hypothetical protein
MVSDRCPVVAGAAYATCEELAAVVAAQARRDRAVGVSGCRAAAAVGVELDELVQAAGWVELDELVQATVQEGR